MSKDDEDNYNNHSDKDEDDAILSEESAYEQSERSSTSGEVSEEYEEDTTESSYTASEPDDDEDVFGYGHRPVGTGRGRPRGRPLGIRGTGRPRGRPRGSRGPRGGGRGRGGAYIMPSYQPYPPYYGYPPAPYYQGTSPGYGLPPLLAAAVERTTSPIIGGNGTQLLQQVSTNAPVEGAAITEAPSTAFAEPGTIESGGEQPERLQTILPKSPDSTSQLRNTVAQELKESISSLLMDPQTRTALLEKLRVAQTMNPPASQFYPRPPYHHMPPPGGTVLGSPGPVPRPPMDPTAPGSLYYQLQYGRPPFKRPVGRPPLASYQHYRPSLSMPPPPGYRPPSMPIGMRPPPFGPATMLGPRKLHVAKTAVVREAESDEESLASTRTRRTAATRRIDYSKFYQEESDEEDGRRRRPTPGPDETGEEGEYDEEEEEEEGKVEKILSYRKKGNKEEFLVKFRKRAYLHSEWINRADMEAESMGPQRIKRFLGRPLSYHHYDDLHPYNPDFDSIDRIVYGWQYHDEATGNMVTSYLVKWGSVPYSDATWETEEWLKTRPDGPDAIKEYHQRLSLDAKRSGYLPLGRRPDPGSWQPFPESPKYKADNTLRSYQLEGLNWLVYCWLNRQSCIIADEMGLGKTVQSVAFMDFLFSHFHLRGPFLVVAPLSTLPHWQREFEAWTNLNVIVYHGSSTSREVMWDYEFFFKTANDQIIPGITKFDVLITTYEVAIAGFEHLEPISWRVAVFDEAHRLKNKASKAADVLKNLNVEHKILLTGTPLQNNVEELWSLLNFLQPQRFFSEEMFLEEYGDLRSHEQVERLQNLLKPLMLRRLKEDVEKSIPVKEETIIEVELTPIQKRYYRAILEKNFGFLLKGTSASNAPNLINTMMELRKCCIHPFLIKGAEERILAELDTDKDEHQIFQALVQSSGKLVLVDKLLKKLREGGHRVLIFSQMTRCLDILADYLRQCHYPFERIDGAIKGSDRQTAIDRFCDLKRDSFAFLLCTKAGGVGINLTAADTVIIFDSDWNPQNDIQAQARCHRIGQTKSVKIYRLLARNTYEREMFDRAGRKLGLDRAILQRMGPQTSLVPGGDDPTTAGLSKQEVEVLLKKGAYGILMDSDEAAMRFCEEDIDQILARRTTVIRHDPTGGADSGTISPDGRQETSIFSKATFSATTDDLDDIDLDDPNFWERWAKKMNVDATQLANASGAGSADEPRIKRQLKRLNKEDLEYEEAQYSIDKNNAKNLDWAIHGPILIDRACSMGIKGISEVASDELVVKLKLSHNEIAACLKAWLRWALDICSSVDPKFKEDNEKLLLWKVEFESTGRKTSEQVLNEFGKSDIPFPGATREQCLTVKEFAKTLPEEADASIITKKVLRIALMELLRGHLEKYADNLAALPIPSTSLSSMPDWWGREEDQSLLVGVYRLGYGQWKKLRDHPDYIFSTMSWKEHEWPSNEVLGDRLRRLVIAMEKRAQVNAKLELAHRQVTLAPRAARRKEEEVSSSEEEESKSSRRHSDRQKKTSTQTTSHPTRASTRNKAKEEEWPYKDKMEFVRLVCLLGEPPNKAKGSEMEIDGDDDEGFLIGSLGRHDWKHYRDYGELHGNRRKTNLQMDRFWQEFVRDCQHIVATTQHRKKKSSEDIDEDFAPSTGGEETVDEEDGGKRKKGHGLKTTAAIGWDRAHKCLERIELFSALRKIIDEFFGGDNKDPEEGDRLMGEILSRARRSSGLPKWWQSGAPHDIPFLKGVAKHGLASPKAIILDESLPFLQILYDEMDRKKLDCAPEAINEPEIVKMIGWPNEGILARRVQYLLDFFGKKQQQPPANNSSSSNKRRTSTDQQASTEESSSPIKKPKKQTKLVFKTVTADTLKDSYSNRDSSHSSRRKKLKDKAEEEEEEEIESGGSQEEEESDYEE